MKQKNPKVVVYRKHPKRENDINRSVIEAVCSFLEGSNIDYEICIIRNDAKRMGQYFVHGDVGIVYGIPKYCRKDYDGMAKLFELQKNMIVAERGFIKRDAYHSFGWDSMNGNAENYNYDMPGNRGKALKTKLRPWKTEGEKILITGQVPWDSNVQGLYTGENRRSRRDVSSAYIEWLKKIFEEISEMGYQDDIVFRPHPYLLEIEKDFTGKYASAIPKEYWSSSSSMSEDLKNAKVLVTFNSNSAVDAVIAGIPVIVGDKGSMAWKVANHSIQDLSDLQMPDRISWLNDIAYSQWNINEIKKGYWWNHLTSRRP